MFFDTYKRTRNKTIFIIFKQELVQIKDGFIRDMNPRPNAPEATIHRNPYKDNENGASTAWHLDLEEELTDQ